MPKSPFGTARQYPFTQNGLNVGGQPINASTSLRLCSSVMVVILESRIELDAHRLEIQKGQASIDSRRNTTTTTADSTSAVPTTHNKQAVSASDGGALPVLFLSHVIIAPYRPPKKGEPKVSLQKLTY